MASLANLSSLVNAKYLEAKVHEGLIFSPTRVAVIKAAGFPFQLRYCPSLSNKPNRPGPPVAGPQGRQTHRDPFEIPPADLLVAQVPVENPTHNLVLNKYPIISRHFIAATKAYKKQTHLLDDDDLAITYACLKSWAGGDGVEEFIAPKRLFAFFNSGRHSGASQAHRHVQFLPIEEMQGDSAEKGWKPLIDIVSENGGKTPFKSDATDRLPFQLFSSSIAGNPTASDLSRLYRGLYDSAVAAVRDICPDDVEQGKSEEDSSVISYNLAMTASTMIICPRRSDSAMLTIGRKGSDKKDQVGPIALNGTILAGSLMVKAQDEWDTLLHDETKLLELLGAIGIPGRSSSTSDIIVGPL